MSVPAPVIAIDGPSASGKGTVARRVAQALGFHFLDSGALYRLVALSALDRARTLRTRRASRGSPVTWMSRSTAREYGSTAGT